MISGIMYGMPNVQITKMTKGQCIKIKYSKVNSDIHFVCAGDSLILSVNTTFAS